MSPRSPAPQPRPARGRGPAGGGATRPVHGYTPEVTSPPLAAAPLEALDQAFEVVLQQAPRAEQDRWLAEADRLRAHDDDASHLRARTVYRALVDRLCEGGAAHLDRAAWAVSTACACDPVQRRLATLALAHPGAAQRAAATCALAACEWRAGDFQQAEQRLRTLLPSARARADELEVAACCVLGSLYAHQNRELEALVLARRALMVAEQRPDLHPTLAAHSILSLAEAYRSLEDAVGLGLTAQRMLAVSTRLSEPDAGRLRMFAYMMAHEAALLRGDLPAAREQLDAAWAEHGRDPKTVGYPEAVLDEHEARLSLRLRDPARAATYIERNLARMGAHPSLGLAWEVHAVEHALAVGQPARALEHAGRALARLSDARQRAELGSGRRLEQAQRLADLLGAAPGGDAAAAQAWREAADAAYDRLRELARAPLDLPEVATPTQEDHETLARFRGRFLRRHTLLLERLRDLLVEARARGELPAWATAALGGFTAMCAWCRSVRDPHGVWLPLGHLIANSGPHLIVTHGICETCRASVGS